MTWGQGRRGGGGGGSSGRNLAVPAFVELLLESRSRLVAGGCFTRAALKG